MLLVAFVAVGANSGKGKEKVTSTIVPKVRLVGSSHSIERTFGGACLVSIENSMLPQTFAGNDQFWGGGAAVDRGGSRGLWRCWH